VGCDVDPEACFAAKFPSQVTGSAESLPFRSAAFDAAYMGEVVEHLWRPLDALLEIRRVLRPDGILVLDTPNAMSLGRVANWWVRHLDDVGDPDHKILFTPATLAGLLHAAGFVVRHMTTDRKLHLGPVSIPWLPGAARLGPHLLATAERVRISLPRSSMPSSDVGASA
jgi:SAM-dependent methyltransferase